MGVNQQIPKDLQAKLDKWEKQKPSYKQTQALEDIADMTQEMLAVLESSSKGEALFRKDLAPLLLDARESLTAIKNKETPQVDQKPVIEAINNLDKTLAKIDIRPEFKPNIDLKAPDVNIAAPKVDLSGIEALLRTEIPQAFANAVGQIPRTELPDTDLAPLVAKYDEMLAVLSNIDTAVRIRAEFPTTMQVSTPSGSPLQTEGAIYATRIADHSSDANIRYIGNATVSNQNNTSGAVWRIQKVGKSGGTTFLFADGDENFDNVWDNRESLSY